MSFSNVAHQILSNNSSCDKKKSINANHPPAYEDLDQGQLALVGRNSNVNFANYKSVQQTGKQRRGSMFKD